MSGTKLAKICDATFGKLLARRKALAEAEGLGLEQGRTKGVVLRWGLYAAGVGAALLLVWYVVVPYVISTPVRVAGQATEAVAEFAGGAKTAVVRGVSSTWDSAGDLFRPPCDEETGEMNGLLRKYTTGFFLASQCEDEAVEGLDEDVEVVQQ